MVTSGGAAKGWSLSENDISTAFLKSGPIKRKIWLVPPMNGNLNADEGWLAKKAIYVAGGWAERFLPYVRQFPAK